MRTRFRLLLCGLALVAMLTVFGTWILFRPRSVPLVMFSVSRYSETIDPNRLVAEDRDRLRDSFAGDSNLQMVDVTVDSQPDWRVSLDEVLNRLRPGGPGQGKLFPENNVVLLYVNAHGVVNQQGQPCLLMSDSHPLNDSTWLPLRALMKRVERQETLAAAHKVLILESGKIRQNWSLGILDNLFCDALQEDFARQPPSGWHVINATRSGQQAQVSQELGGSVFSYFVAQGLRGAADLDDNRRVSLLELDQYLEQQVYAWTTRYCGAAQKPCLISSQAIEVDLTYVSTYASPVVEPREVSDSRVETVNRIWSQFSRIDYQRTLRRVPKVVAQVQRRLGRLEDLLVSGGAYENEFDALAEDLELAITRLASKPVLDRVEAVPNLASIVLAQRRSPLTSAQINVAMQALQAWPPKELESEPEKETEVVPAQPPVQIDPRAALMVGYRSLMQGSTESFQDRIESILAFWQSQGGGQSGPKEFHLLRLLIENVDWAAKDIGASAQLALQTQSALEGLATPEDVRGFHWIRPFLARYETEWQAAFDELLVGSEAALQSADSRWNRILAGVVRVNQDADMVGRAYAIRDEIWAQAGFLAQWMLVYPDLPDVKNRVETLNSVIERSRQLRTMLDENLAVSLSAADLAKVQTLSVKLRADWESLLADYDRICDTLANTETGLVETTRRKLGVTVRVPLLTRHRAALRNQYLRRLEGVAYELDSTSSQSGGLRISGHPLLDQLNGLTRHPGVVLLADSILFDPDGDSSTRLQWKPTGQLPQSSTVENTKNRGPYILHVGFLGGRLRQCLQEGPQVLRQAMEEAENIEVPRGGADQRSNWPSWARQSRIGLSRCAYWIRVTAGWGAPQESQVMESTPTDTLRRLDWSLLFAWHIERLYEDCWGPVGGQRISFFSLAAREYLSVSRQLFFGMTGFHELLDEMLRSRETAIQQWNPVSVEDVVSDAGRETLSHRFERNVDGDFPPGTASLYIQTGLQELVPVLHPTTLQTIRRQSTTITRGVTPHPAEFRYLLSQSTVVTVPLPLTATALYRGHVYRTGFLVGSDGPLITYRRSTGKGAKIRVVGDLSQTNQVILVLDCSGSMSRRLPSDEGPLRTRLDVARSSLLTVLESLPVEKYHVGLVLYGHRTGWKYTGNSRQERTWLPGAEDLDVGEDVELVVPVRSLNPSEGDTRGKIRARLRTLNPLGVTPLYFALRQSLQSFREDLVGTRHVIVITDGLNNIEDSESPLAKTTADMVKELLQQPDMKAQVDIIGFALEKSQQEKDYKSLIDIARNQNSGGDFYQARDPSSLLAALRESLRPVRYVVEQGGIVVPQGASSRELNQTWVLNSIGDKAEYQVALVDYDEPVSTSVRLEGGESVELFVQGNQLQHRRYRNQLRESIEEVIDPQDPTRRFFIGAHLPERHGASEVWLRMSVQNARADRFSVRPRRVWAEVRPVAARDRVYYASDAEWEPGTPVPVLRLRLHHWPAGCDLAEIKLRYAMADSPAEQVFAFDPKLPRQKFQWNGVELQIETRSISGADFREFVVREQHPTDREFSPLLVQLRPASENIRHTYFRDKHRAVHVFICRARDLAGMPQAQLHLTRATVGGPLDKWVSAAPLEVQIPPR